ncbi:33353_t:CDS:2 [Racocetra persica]|uniref:33353_t:CDS:1 n=1 Tax=Racocetra persica TaxID=160502 RepID=A0ACA9MPZ0_9GLOM|nr:33353_t:CDS:2 [Racocetra persica]
MEKVLTQFTINKIAQGNLEDSPFKDINYRRLSDDPNKFIIRKSYLGNDVACRPTKVKFDNTLDSQNIQAQLVILEKLKESPNILKFYGLSEVDDYQVMVFEWVEVNLMEIYTKNDIDWDLKALIALDICRGLLFLHSCDILHHDIRCKNIMITSRLGAKISNFQYAKIKTDSTIPIPRVDDMIPWMAPEKLNGFKYNFKSWEGIPQIRATLQQIFLKLVELSEICKKPSYQYVLYPDGHIDFDGSNSNSNPS